MTENKPSKKTEKAVEMNDNEPCVDTDDIGSSDSKIVLNEQEPISVAYQNDAKVISAINDQ